MTENLQTFILIAILALLITQRFSTRKVQSKNEILLDSSTIIDGRIIDIALAGFVPGTLVVPNFIVAELQLIADSQDPHKRERARFGLDVVSRLQEEIKDVKIMDFNVSSKMTDDKLLEVAKKRSSILCTNDFNLNKVAVIAGIKVLNVNELAQAVRPTALPGEKHNVKIVQKGSNKDQGVAYLDDGTMIVVSGAGKMIGKKADVSVTRMLQTEAGKMMFARLAQSNNPGSRRRKA